MVKKITLDGVAMSVTKKKIKNMHLRIYPPDGRVHISVPVWMNVEQIYAFALAKLDWIKKHQQTLQQQPPEPAHQYLEHERHLLWGQHYLLKVFETTHKSKVEIQDNLLCLYIPQRTNVAKRQAMVEAWYREQLKQAISPLIAKWEPCMRVKVSKFFIQRMKTRWGSCNPRARHLRFNTELAKKSLICLEYVIVHEMVHLLEPSHNHRFKRLMSQFLPEWRLHREQLNHKLQSKSEHDHASPKTIDTLSSTC